MFTQEDIDNCIKYGITKESFEDIFSDVKQKHGEEIFRKLESTQKDIKKLVDKKAKYFSKFGDFREVLYYYGSKIGSMFKQELDDAVIFTNKFMSVYDKRISGVMDISYSISYNDIESIGYDQKSNTLTIYMYGGMEYKPLISYCEETYYLISQINKYNRYMRDKAGIIDSMSVSEGYGEALNKLKKSVGDRVFSKLAKDYNDISYNKSLFLKKHELDLMKCGFYFTYPGELIEAEEKDEEDNKEDNEKGNVYRTVLAAFDNKRNMFYWVTLSAGKTGDKANEMSLGKIKNAWIDEGVLYIHHNLKDVTQIVSPLYAEHLLKALMAFVKTSDSWHREFVVDGKIAPELDIERIKQSTNLATYTETYEVLTSCAHNSGMTTYDLIKASRDHVAKEILAGYVWSQYLADSIDEELFWIYIAALLNKDNAEYSTDWCYNRKTTHPALKYNVKDPRELSHLSTNTKMLNLMSYDTDLNAKVRRVTYSYQYEDIYFFMDCETYDQHEVTAFNLGNLASKLVEDKEYELYLFKDKPVFVKSIRQKPSK